MECIYFIKKKVSLFIYTWTDSQVTKMFHDHVTRTFQIMGFLTCRACGHLRTLVRHFNDTSSKKIIAISQFFLQPWSFLCKYEYRIVFNFSWLNSNPICLNAYSLYTGLSHICMQYMWNIAVSPVSDVWEITMLDPSLYPDTSQPCRLSM